MSTLLIPLNLLRGKETQHFSILSIGKRGVGKTVFIAGSYAELHAKDRAAHPHELWFDSQENQEDENIKNILDYISQTGKYPPPTMKIYNSNLSLKYQGRSGVQTLCHFIWSDIPGEICHIENSDFRRMVFNSHGCCVFIDAAALLYQPAYNKELQEIVQQITPLAKLVYLNSLKYTFAIVLTKCDLLKDDPLIQQHINQKLKPLISEFERTYTKYKIFYSYIPIVSQGGFSVFQPQGAAAPLLWLVWEINQNHNHKLRNNLIRSVSNLLPQKFQPQAIIVEGTLQKLIKSTNKVAGIKNPILYRALLFSRKNIFIIVTVISIIGVLGTIVSQRNVDSYEQNKPSNTNTLKF